jgi:23S rRNA (guanine745-N1)-methyltransferase
MSIEDVLDLLVCPQCRNPLGFGPEHHSVRCAAGHAFDLSRQGYLNLLGSKPPRNADTASMVSARDRFLAQGHYGPVADRVRKLAVDFGSERPNVAEVGAGTGYYLAEVLEALAGARGIALDVSIAASRRAARSHPRVGAVVADVWRLLPLAERSLDIIMNVFAPRNSAEFRRVLSDSGRLITVSPEPDHLQELRWPLRLLQIQERKQERLAATLTADFVEESRERLCFHPRLGADSLADLVAMGPNAFHRSDDERDDALAGIEVPMDVSVAVSLSVWAPRS